jgi:patatin-like phospholipase/acyl hydrolase
MYKILSIDGGGLHGYADVIILRRLMEKCPNLLNDVDLIAGTSVGGIVGLGMAMGHKIDIVEKNFVDGVPLAFTPEYPRTFGFYLGLCSKYNTKHFKKFLEFVYNGLCLGDLKKKVVIPAFCLDDESPVRRRWKPKIFHNFSSPDYNLKLIDVAMATSAVPVIFPAYGKYIDGAVVANNPTLCAVAQTQDEQNIGIRPKLEDICVLSLGTVRDEYVEGKNFDWGYLKWIKTILELLPERDLPIINYQASLLLGSRYHRIEPIINVPMDDVKGFDAIRKISLDYDIQDADVWLNKNWR